MKYVMLLFVSHCFTMPFLAFSQNTNEAIEPTFKDLGTVDLLEGGTLDAWKVPSEHWIIDGKSIVGHTDGKKLECPEWLYTKQGFSDFAFTCELKLSGDSKRNTGIYYRANIILYPGNQNIVKPFEAPSGYEFDAAFHNPTEEKNFTGSLGDWYVRPYLRIYPDQAIINKIYKQETWNRLTLRARGNRLEYWINGIKVMDYLDYDPKASREGIIGFQLHNGSVMKVAYRNIRVLPIEP